MSAARPDSIVVPEVPPEFRGGGAHVYISAPFVPGVGQAAAAPPPPDCPPFILIDDFLASFGEPQQISAGDPFVPLYALAGPFPGHVLGSWRTLDTPDSAGNAEVGTLYASAGGGLSLAAILDRYPAPLSFSLAYQGGLGAHNSVDGSGLGSVDLSAASGLYLQIDDTPGEDPFGQPLPLDFGAVLTIWWSGGAQSHSAPYSYPGAGQHLYMPFSDFPGVDPAAVSAIALEFSLPARGYVHILSLTAQGPEYSQPVLAGFDADQAPAGQPFQFADASAGPAAAWLWAFGDGATSAEQSPVHSYAAAGTYTVSLTASDACGYGTTIEHPIVIYANNPPVAVIAGAVDGALYLSFEGTGPFQIDGAASYDPDEGETLTLAYLWEISDQIVVDDPTSDIAVCNLVEAGARIIPGGAALTVTDIHGASHSTTADLYINWF
jgi:hypothetical protein